MKRGIYYIGLLLLFFSCRKDVTLDLPEYQDKIVVEASIETGGPAMVFLSNSVPYFGDFDYSKPERAFIKGATVTISDGTSTETLRELDPSLGYLYMGSTLLGQEGRTYTLRVTVNDKSYEASSTILKPVSLDSLYFIGIKTDSLGFIGQKFHEPETMGDCYRWMAKRLGRDRFYAAPFNSVFDDKFINGKTFEFSYDRGVQPYRYMEAEDLEKGYYKTGDTIVVKFCKIGRTEYDFWFSYYQNKLSNGNPFSSPANVKSNFNNYKECFGAFIAYAPAFDTIIIPK